MLRTLWPYRYVIAHLAWRRLRNRYRRTVVGVAWTMLLPLAMAMVLALVYASILGRDFESYALYLLCGLFPFAFVTEVSGHACGAYPQSRGLLNQVAVPVAVFPTIAYLANAISFCLAFGALVLLLTVTGFLYPLGLIYALPGLILLLLFGWGFAQIQAVLGGIFRDYEYISGVLLRMLFFATPILYRTEMMDDHGRSWIYEYNPLYYFIHGVRHPLITGDMVDAHILGIAATITIIAGLLGSYLVRKIDRKIVHFL